MASDEDCLTWLATYRSHDLEWYQALPPGILRADAIRLIWLHEYGGVYADMDVECLRPLDELAERVNSSPYSLGLTRDHPVHERIHFGNTPMWMNDFMVAKPGAALLGEALRLLEADIRTGREFIPRNAVMETGPGLLNRAIASLGELEAAGVLHIPWTEIHPLPDMTNTFPEKEQVDLSIRGKSWRNSAPFVAHYWYHTWCSTRNMVVAYHDCLFAERSEALNERLNHYREYLGRRKATIPLVLEKLAQLEGPVTVVELGITRSYISDPPEGVDGANPVCWQPRDASMWDWGAGSFSRVAVESLGGYDFHFHGVDPSPEAHKVATGVLEPLLAGTGEMEAVSHIRASLADFLGEEVFAWQGSADLTRRVHWHRSTARDFLASLDAPVDLIYMDHGECGEATAEMHEQDARLIVERGLVKEGGFVLIDDHDFEAITGNVPKSKYSRKIFEGEGWATVSEGFQLLMQRPWEVVEYVPRLVHVFCDRRRLTAYGQRIPAAWRGLHPGWEIKFWDDDGLRDLVSHEYPDFLNTFVSYRNDRQRMNASKFLVLKKFGGVVTGPDILPLRSLEELLAGKALFLAFLHPVKQGEIEPSVSLGTDFMASSPGHPFWNGVEHDLTTRLKAETDSATGAAFLTNRVQHGLSFLEGPDEWPELLDCQVLYGLQNSDFIPKDLSDDSLRAAFPEAFLVKLPRATLQRYPVIGNPVGDDDLLKNIGVALMTVQRSTVYVHKTIRGLRMEWPSVAANPLMLFPGSLETAFVERYRQDEAIIIEETTIGEWEKMHWWNTHRKAMWNYWRCLSRNPMEIHKCQIGRLILEDDLQFAEGWTVRLRRTLEQILRDIGPHFVLSLYSPHDRVKKAYAEGKLYMAYPTKDFYATQAMFFSDSVRRDFSEYIRHYGVEDNLLPYDLLLADYCAFCDVPLLTAVPSLVQHIGVESTGLGAVHQSPSFLPRIESGDLQTPHTVVALTSGSRSDEN